MNNKRDRDVLLMNSKKDRGCIFIAKRTEDVLLMKSKKDRGCIIAVIS